MKVLIVLISILSSGTALAACEAGQMTVLTSSVEFQRAESSGRQLKVVLPAGSEVHVVALTGELVGLFATTEIQGQNLSFTSTGFKSDVLKVLRCSASEN